MRLWSVLIIVAVVLTGCASPHNTRSAINYARLGAAAEARGDWAAARDDFAQAAKYGDASELEPKTLAIYHYEYGRALGVTCAFDDAERELNLAYDLDKRSGQPLYLSLVELARLSLDQRKYSNAISYFERAVPELDRANLAKNAPIAYADILDEYAFALSAVGRAQDSTNANRRAAEIRGANPRGSSITDRTPYGKRCNKR